MGVLKEFFKTATGGGLVSSLANGLFGMAGQALQNKYQKQQMKMQHENTLEQMEQSQAYNLANMERQNQYQIDAEERAQEWNSIGAQAQRARSSGISPIAALGGSSGGTLSQSTAPSSSTPSPGGASMGAVGQLGSLGLNLSQTIAQDKHLENETKLADAQVEKMRQETIAQQLENQITPMLNELKLDDIETQKLKNSVERAIYSGNTESLAFKQALQQLDLLVKDSAVKDEIKNHIIAQIDTEKARAKNLDSSTDKNIADTKYQELINEKFEKYGLTPNSSQVGLALGLGTSLINALGGENVSKEQVANNVVQFIWKNSNIKKLVDLSHKLDSWIAEKYRSISSKQRKRIVDAAISASNSQF